MRLSGRALGQSAALGWPAGSSVSFRYTTVRQCPIDHRRNRSIGEREGISRPLDHNLSVWHCQPKLQLRFAAEAFLFGPQFP